ncbi:MAG: hypothetical protein V3V11_02250 [Vicinamibacteria bacterium]
MASRRKKKARKKTPRMTATTRWVSFRLPHDLVERLDRHAEAESKRTGYTVNRTQALIKLLSHL